MKYRIFYILVLILLCIPYCIIFSECYKQHLTISQIIVVTLVLTLFMFLIFIICIGILTMINEEFVNNSFIEFSYDLQLLLKQIKHFFKFYFYP